MIPKSTDGRRVTKKPGMFILLKNKIGSTRDIISLGKQSKKMMRGFWKLPWPILYKEQNGNVKL